MNKGFNIFGIRIYYFYCNTYFSFSLYYISLLCFLFIVFPASRNLFYVCIFDSEYLIIKTKKSSPSTTIAISYAILVYQYFYLIYYSKHVFNMQCWILNYLLSLNLLGTLYSVHTKDEPYSLHTHFITHYTLTWEIETYFYFIILK